MTKFDRFYGFMISMMLVTGINGMHRQPVVPSIRDRSTVERDNLLDQVKAWKAQSQALKAMNRAQPQTRKAFDSWRVDGENLKMEAANSGAAVMARDISAFIGSVARSLGYLE